MQLPRWLLAALATVSLACSDDPFAPTIENVAGSYTATTLTTTTGSITTDHLAAGASFTIALALNGATTGRLFVPGFGDEDLVGTWTLVGSTVEFAHTADTFVRDMRFTASARRLQGEGTFSVTTYRVTLAK